MHAPERYDCPFCHILKGGNEARKEEIVYEDDSVAVFPAKHHKIGNEGNLLVVSKSHIENLYDLPAGIAQPLLTATKLAARVLKSVLECDGITIRQNNEPASGQDVWHYHIHVIPRYVGDNYVSAKWKVSPERERFALAQKLRSATT